MLNINEEPKSSH